MVSVVADVMMRDLVITAVSYFPCSFYWPLLRDDNNQSRGKWLKIFYLDHLVHIVHLALSDNHRSFSKSIFILEREWSISCLAQAHDMPGELLF